MGERPSSPGFPVLPSHVGPRQSGALGRSAVILGRERRRDFGGGGSVLRLGCVSSAAAAAAGLQVGPSEPLRGCGDWGIAGQRQRGESCTGSGIAPWNAKQNFAWSAVSGFPPASFSPREKSKGSKYVGKYKRSALPPPRVKVRIQTCRQALLVHAHPQPGCVRVCDQMSRGTEFPFDGKVVGGMLSWLPPGSLFARASQVFRGLRGLRLPLVGSLQPAILG